RREALLGLLADLAAAWCSSSCSRETPSNHRRRGQPRNTRRGTRASGSRKKDRRTGKQRTARRLLTDPSLLLSIFLLLLSFFVYSVVVLLSASPSPSSHQRRSLSAGTSRATWCRPRRAEPAALRIGAGLSVSQ